MTSFGIIHVAARAAQTLNQNLLMRKKEIDQEDWLRIIAAARLRSEGRTQTEIAARLGFSQPEVSRLLEEAMERKILSKGPALRRRNIPESDYEAAEQAHLMKDHLAKVLAPLVPQRVHFEVRVAPGDENTFAFAAARRVVDLIVRSRRIGIMWGRSVLDLVRGIVALSDAFDPAQILDVECIPLCGDPLFLINDRRVRQSSSYLAATLEEALNASKSKGLPCLAGVPAYISRQRAQDSGTTVDTWRRFLQGIPGYEAIFGNTRESTKALIHGVDTIITGVGTIVMVKEAPWRETGDFIMERLIQDSFSKPEMNRLIYGDIGGILLPREKLSIADMRQVEELNAGWMGLKLSHLQTVASRATPGKVPGVIVVAYGRWKAEMVKECIRRGLVNQLIVDPALADALGARD
jgi:DNA-binding transcriptional regulator LsrR (DeoR family)